MRYLTRALPNGGGYVQIAEFYDERRDSFLGLLAGFTMPLLALIVLGAAMLTRSVNRMVEPIGMFGRQLQDRGGSNLSPIDIVDLPVELSPIVNDVNRLFGRLRSAMQAERAFSANCAHELRNPVAAARAHAEFIKLFPDDASNAVRIATLEDSLGELGRRIERLLQLSRAEAHAGLMSGSSDLVAVTRLLTDDYARQGRNIGFDAGSSPTLAVAIDKDALGIAIQNLVDNAIVHAIPATRIDVRIAPSGSLHVINDCAPIQTIDLDRLRERFRRDQGAKVGGYGLGLAIVGELMRQVGGQLQLQSPASGRSTGFEAIMTLPAA